MASVKTNAVETVTKTDTTTLLLVAAAVLAFPLIAKAQAGARVKLRFIRIHSLTFDGFRVKLVVEFAIQNPTAESFTVTSFSGDLFINGSDVGDASNYTTTVIAPQATTNYQLTFFLPAAGIVLELIKRITGQATGAFTAQFAGRVVVDGFSLPVSESFAL